MVREKMGLGTLSRFRIQDAVTRIFFCSRVGRNRPGSRSLGNGLEFDYKFNEYQILRAAHHTHDSMTGMMTRVVDYKKRREMKERKKTRLHDWNDDMRS